MYNKQRTAKSYSITSPYMDLLQSKKKVYGLKYHSSLAGNASHSKSVHNQNQSGVHSSSVKGRPASSSVASHHNKSAIKSNSSQKVKSTKSQNQKKKRIYTQQAQNFNQLTSDPKLHESLFVNMENKNKPIELGLKSLFPNQPSKNNYLNNYDFLKKFSDFNAQIKDKQQQQMKQKQQQVNFSASKSQKSNKSTKSRSKTAQNSKGFQNKNTMMETITIGKSIQQLGLNEVQDLICLIDNCLQEANEYISFLAGKVESLKNELMKSKAEQFELERIIKEKNKQLQMKDVQISKLKNQLYSLQSNKSSSSAINLSNNQNQNQSHEEDFKNKEIKKILEVLNQMNERNQFLESKVKGLESQIPQKNDKFPSQLRDNAQDWISAGFEINPKIKQKRKSSNNKDIYNEIHSKIDILNISIDNKKTTQNNR